MESAMTAGLLAHPIALAVLFAIAYLAIHFTSVAFAPAALTKRSLWLALAGVLLAALLLSAFFAYTTPEDARRIGVSAENYWSAIWREFVVLGVVSSYLGLLGASMVGIPLALFMARRGMATVPWYVLASLPISLAWAAALGALAGGEHSHAARDTAFFAGVHAWLAFGFAIGARLPWRRQKRRSNDA
jgi:hypothetical protein